MNHLKIVFSCFIVASLLAFSNSVLAQTDTSNTQETTTEETTLYTLIYNEVPNNSSLPLLGVVNNAQGNHSGLQLGVVNINHQNFAGLQLGFVSLVKGNLLGMQIGFLNFGSQSAKALQIGFGNHVQGDLRGSQIGFFNVSRKTMNGLQLGFVNETGNDARGVQLGFLNESGANTDGVQLGFINNAQQTVNGCQIGFLNVADSISSGVPIGFFSYVKKGGYMAVEFSASELYPVSIGFKTGIPLLYSIIQGSYSHTFNRKFALGTGLGSLLKLKENLYFNPEAIYHSSLVSDGIQATSLRLNLRYSLSSNLQVAGGISFVQLNQNKNSSDKSWFSLANFKINDNDRLLIGAVLSFTYNLTKL